MGTVSAGEAGVCQRVEQMGESSGVVAEGQESCSQVVGCGGVGPG